GHRVIKGSIDPVREPNRSDHQRRESEAVRINLVFDKTRHGPGSSGEPKLTAGRTCWKRAVGQAPESMRQCKRSAKADGRGNVVMCVARGARIPVNLIAMDAVVYVESRSRKAVTQSRSASAGDLCLLA